MNILNIFSSIKDALIGIVTLFGGMFVVKRVEEAQEVKQNLKKKTIELDSVQNEMHKIKQNAKVDEEMNVAKKKESEVIRNTKKETNEEVDQVNKKIDSLKDGNETKISI